MSRIRNATAAVSVAALIGAGGLTAAQAATSSGSSSPARPAHRHGGPLASAQLAAIASRLGVTTAQLKAAMQASGPARPAGGPGAGGPDGMATDLATALGADVTKVEAILDANRPERSTRGKTPGARPARPDTTKLAAALASGLKIGEATVKAAFDKLDAARKKDHRERESTMYAAVAAQLGASADAVQAAFEANRPARPAA